MARKRFENLDTFVVWWSSAKAAPAVVVVDNGFGGARRATQCMPYLVPTNLTLYS